MAETELADGDENSGKLEVVQRFIDLFEEAFDELHAAVLEKLRNPNQYLSNHYDYPQMMRGDAGFPTFTETGTFDKAGRKNYVQTVRGYGLLSVLMIGKDEKQLPSIIRLTEFLQSNDLGKKFISHHSDKVSEFSVHVMVSSTVESYFQRFGTGPLDNQLRWRAMAKMLFGCLTNQVFLKLIVPIALTHFDVDHYRLTDTTYITRIPKGIQLSRARMDLRGSGAVKHVVGAATHAFISTAWSVEVTTRDQLRHSLNDPSRNVLDEADLFFAALRGATGAKTGYAQIAFLPTNAVVDVYCDLPTIYGATYRRYPSEFDQYGWVYGGQSRITKEQMDDVKRLYNLILERPEDRVRLALKRLNTCMSRDDAMDAILDATIALEILLGDTKGEAIAYKIRMRAGALAAHQGDRKATEVLAAVKKLYETRSKIVHGSTFMKKAKQVVPDEERFILERNAAIEVLRYILRCLLEHPRFLQPERIDEELLLGSPLNSGEG